jgi:hypothetical protein
MRIERPQWFPVARQDIVSNCWSLKTKGLMVALRGIEPVFMVELHNRLRGGNKR